MNQPPPQEIPGSAQGPPTQPVATRNLTSLKSKLAKLASKGPPRSLKPLPEVQQQPRIEETITTLYSGQFPDEYARALEDGGLYPDVEDPQFVSRLLRKSEFADTVSTFNPNQTPCETSEFEVTPVQRFVANFLHPRTPYRSMLLYHGVGVGKTCAAIQSAEAYLDIYPRRKVFIVCPRAIRSGFYRTIFDIRNVTIGKGAAFNSNNGCTGDVYLKLANCLTERNLEVIEAKVKRVIDRRYAFFGYIEFQRYIRNILNSVPKGGEREAELRATMLQKEFDYRLLIIDEAHNLRDVAGSAVLQQEDDDVDTIVDEDDSKGGKELTPFLKELVSNMEGLKLLLMTATPMFNSVFEIHFLLNLMILNDKRPEIPMSALLNKDGTPAPGSEQLFQRLANRYISFMRGENPTSFPIRLYPQGNDPNGQPVKRLTVETYPKLELTSELDEPTPPAIAEKMSNLPIVLSSAEPNSTYDTVLKTITTENVSARGAGYQVIDMLLQSGNCIFPAEEEGVSMSSLIGVTGFKSVFTTASKGAVKAKRTDWLLAETFEHYSPKGATVLRYLRNGEGVQFVYSRFVTTGALLLAIALEVNGYTAYGRDPLLTNPPTDTPGRQCALCSTREREHSGSSHTFIPAKYAILTGDPLISPGTYNADAIGVARSAENKNGEKIKVVIGSQIAAEGIDLRFIREVHVFDAWFHLNKTEQIIGRGIRYCSHSLLPPEKRNCTIFLHCAAFADTTSLETADILCYRKALEKAINVGVISRELKIGAVDCNLRKSVTVLKGIGRRKQIDSQRQPRNGPKGEVQKEGDGILLDDTDFTIVCDWMECKPITCIPDQAISLSASDDSTFDAFSARYRQSAIQKVIKAIFAQSPYQRQEDLIQILLQQGIPRTAIDITLQGIINNRLFRIKSGAQEGYIIYKNKYFLFQPDVYKDLKIPMALRIAPFPIKRDEYSPMPMIAAPPEIPLIKDQVVLPGVEEALSVKDFWNDLVKWVSKVVDTNQTHVDVDIERKIELFVKDYKSQKATFHDKLDIIVFVNKKIQNKELYKRLVLEYLWDEWIHPIQQVQLILQGIVDPEIAREQILKSGSVTAIRSLDLDTTNLVYTCEDGKPCASKSLIESLEKLESDTVNKRKADVVHAAKLFGYVVPKYDKMVFKTQEPHPIDGKPGVGQECAIVARKSMYMDKLNFIGNELRRVGAPDLGLNEPTIQLEHAEIKNAGRGCTYLDLILRYCDTTRAGKKRWFFRPIAAYWAGLRGVVSKAAKAKLSVAERELKTMVEPGVATVKKLKKPVPTAAVVAPVAAAPPVAPPIVKKLKKPTAAPAVQLSQPVVPESVPTQAEQPVPIVKKLKKPTAAPVEQVSLPVTPEQMHPKEKPCGPKKQELYSLPEETQEKIPEQVTLPPSIVEPKLQPIQEKQKEDEEEALFNEISEEDELLANALKQQAEEEARKKAEEANRAEEEAKQKAEEEAKQKAAEENARKKALTAAQAKPAPTIAKLKPLGKPSVLQKPKQTVRPKPTNENDYI